MTNANLTSKPRYEILDGLRGVAAMVVVAFHLFETYSAGPAFQILNHGYLAVDFFFVLSGFVIGYAYDDRWNRMSLWDFAKRRLIRLHPMLIMGTLIGGALFFLGMGDAFPQIGKTSVWMWLLCIVLGCLSIPTTPRWDIRGWQEMNALNGATWSLFWEYIANILYALFIRHFPTKVLAIFVAVSALLTVDLTLNLDFFGLLANRPREAYSVIGGWAITPEQLYIGISRLLYPFFAGLLLSRVGKFIRVRGGFWWCSLLITCVLVFPYIGGSEKNIYDGLFQLVSILVVFPLIVAMGAGSSVTDARSMAVCKFLGALSYPLYITHYPLIYLHIAWHTAHPEATMGQNIAVSVSIFFVAIATAYAALKLYDEPVRKWLQKKSR